MMKKLSVLCLLMLVFAGARANDGAFYSAGNHLIPITESDIKVQKEILKITRVEDTSWLNRFQVDVYYEFFNPGKAKDLIVGFEATTPSGDAYYGTLEQAYASQPFIYDFKVDMNGSNLPYQVAHVPYKYKGDWQFDYSRRVGDYYKNGQITDVSMEQYKAYLGSALGEDGDDEYLDEYGYFFYYVYHFNAHFNEGLNIIRHTYSFNGASSVVAPYSFDYILTAANRWANNGIDDFTLIVDMDEKEPFLCGIEGVGEDEWSFTGRGMKSARGWRVHSGNLVLHKKNFHPKGELEIMKVDNDNMYYEGDKEDFMALLKESYLDLTRDYALYVSEFGLTKEEKRILRNLPFAYQGHVFKDKGLRQFFESTKWYVPDPEYKDDMGNMNRGEREWIEFWSK